ncbi:MAG: hypothetical protein ABEN55_19730 [Bradymonadaceae bacterium]
MVNGRAISRQTGGVGQVGRVGLATATAGLLWMAAAGCVETADCNESVRCSDGEICYRYECRPRCDRERDCGEEASCRPCVDPETEENRCFGEQARACVLDRE